VHDEDPAHQLDALIGNVGVKQLLGGQETGGHVGNVRALGGHDKQDGRRDHRSCNCTAVEFRTGIVRETASQEKGSTVMMADE